MAVASYDTASVILAVEELAGECYLGIAGVNFKAKPWDRDLGPEPGGLAPWATVRCSDGKLFFKGTQMDQRLCQIVAGDRVGIDIMQRESKMTIRVLRPDASVKSGPTIWLDVQDVEITNLHNEVAIAVALGETTQGATSRVRIVGSSCERTAPIQASDTQKTEEEQSGGKKDAYTEVAKSC